MNYVGCLVSLNCGDVLGVYQGQVKKVDGTAQSLTICRPFRNGVKCEIPEITISACDIKELKMVKAANEAEAENILSQKSTPSKLSFLASAAQPVCKDTKTDTSGTNNSNKTVPSSSNSVNMTDRQECLNTCDSRCTPTRDKQIVEYFSYSYPLNNPYANQAQGRDKDYNCGSMSQSNHTATRDKDHTLNGNASRGRDRYEDNCRTGTSVAQDEQSKIRLNSVSEEKSCQKPSVPKRTEQQKKALTKDDCFSTPAETILDDFDFEKNLALFDKKAVFEEIENSNVDGLAADKKPTKYRCDENVLQSKPAKFQQIKVPKDCGKSYFTDTGLVVPCIDYDMRNKIFDLAEAYGFSVERRQEMIGRSASEMVLQLLGGSSRLNPTNGHQLPTVLVLCGPHMQGAQGLSCARHLVNHGVQTIVFLPNFLRMLQCVEQEMKLYDLCSGKKYSNERDIPSGAVDMIVNCMDNHENSFLKQQSWYQSHVRWVSQCRAPVFTIDPPIKESEIIPKWCLFPVLPLATSEITSQVYLCDIGLPRNVFKEVGITYRSPFGHKFTIPLHPKT